MSIYKLSTDNYEELNTNIQDILKTGISSCVSITIYLDSNGSQIVNTKMGHLENKHIKNISQRASYEDKNTRENHLAVLTIAFKDGGALDYNNGMIDCWYSLSGVENSVRKKFG
jgi:hypothetical protein